MLKFFKSPSGARASSPELLIVGDEPTDLPTMQEEVSSP